MKHPETARRLQEALASKNMLPSELAAKSGVSKASISQYINGSHAPSNLSSTKMAEVLKVNPLWLMGFELPQNNSPDDELIDIYKSLSPEAQEQLIKYAEFLSQGDK